MKGVYDGNMTVGQLRPYGDFGLGTFQALNGEMLELDSIFYRANLDGSITVVPDDTITPFAVVTFLDNDKVISVNQQMDLNQLQSYVDGQLASQNLFYAVKIEGKFSYMKTRSVPEQTKPYPPLTEAVKHQQVTEFHDVEGTIIAFRCPPYVDGVNVPGYPTSSIRPGKWVAMSLIFKLQTLR
jgi:acetolactate decarboxylase